MHPYRWLTAFERLRWIAAEHRIERVNLVHRLCGFDPLNWLGRLSGFRFLDRFGSECRFDLVRAFPLVCPGMAVSRQYRAGPSPDSSASACSRSWPPKVPALQACVAWCILKCREGCWLIGGGGGGCRYPGSLAR